MKAKKAVLPATTALATVLQDDFNALIAQYKKAITPGATVDELSQLVASAVTDAVQLTTKAGQFSADEKKQAVQVFAAQFYVEVMPTAVTAIDWSSILGPFLQQLLTQLFSAPTITGTLGPILQQVFSQLVTALISALLGNITPTPNPTPDPVPGPSDY